MEDHSTEKKACSSELLPVPASATDNYPEGGPAAWLVVLGCFCVFFVTFGYANAFGVYEAYYLQTTLSHESPSKVAWIGSILSFCQFSAGLISGPVTDRYGPRVVIWPGMILYVASVMLTSVSKEYYQFLLAQGILGGITNGLTYTPAIAILGQYFHRRRAIAMGIVSSGSSLGGILFPIILSRLFNHSLIGFGWAVRIVGFIILALCLVAMVTVVPRLPPRTGSYLLLDAFKKPAYTAQVVGVFMIFIGLNTPFFYISTFARFHGVNDDLSLYLVAILNSVSMIGRLASGFIAQHTGRLNLLCINGLLSAVLVFCWIRMISRAAIIVFAVLFGFTSGSILALFPTTLAQMAPSPNQIGSYVGMGLGIYGFGTLIGAPITGLLISRYSGYDQALIFSGSFLLVGSIFVVVARFQQPMKGVIVA